MKPCTIRLTHKGKADRNPISGAKRVYIQFDLVLEDGGVVQSFENAMQIGDTLNLKGFFESGDAITDAERYRWLKKINPLAVCQIAWSNLAACEHAEPDAAVDAAISTPEKQRT